MTFGQLDYEIQQCEQHLDRTATRNTLVESYFVRYLLIRICAEYEARIKILVHRRHAHIKDQHLLNFAQWATNFGTQRFSVSDITGTLGKFGDDYKQNFKNAVNSQPCHAAWDNIYNNRNLVAHVPGSVLMTFSDLKSNYNASLLVIEEIVKALNLSLNDIKDLI